MQNPKRPDNIALRGDDAAVVILDQSLLPNEREFCELATPDAMFEAIHQLRVRGAPAIGIFAGFCYYVLARGEEVSEAGEWLARCEAHAAHLESSRPTAVNLAWALKRMTKLHAACARLPREAALQQLRSEAFAIQNEDIAMCTAIARHGLSLLQAGDGVLTHCNAGPLATSLYGAALGPLLLAQEKGIPLRVFADETRPLLQGARLTSYELQQAGVDVTLICDSMAATVMKNGWVNACFVGCDRVAANGDVANKIGTLGVAILARHYGVPFYVLGPSSTVDPNCPTGADITIELRDEDEIRSKWYARPMAPEGVKCYNPAFDVTDHTLITGIITEHGIARPPYTQSLAEWF